MSATVAGKAPAWLRIIGIVALLWNLIGVCFYLGHVGALGPPFAQPDAPVMPGWVIGAYAIGVFGGVIGSLGLILAAHWSRPVLWISFIALIVDWGWVFRVAGSAALPLGLTVLVIAALLVWLATHAGRKGWLR